MILPAVPFTHLLRLTDRGGLYEHALGTVPRREHGYCVDDVARALVVVCRAAGSAPPGLREQYLWFVLAAEDGAGQFRNRRSADRNWHGDFSVEDCWGRALWGLGTAAARGGSELGQQRARAAFVRGAALRAPWTRAMAFAALGAAEILRLDPAHPVARSLLADAAAGIGQPRPGHWAWPEDRLTYANAALPETLIAAGQLLEDRTLLAQGLELLEWLLREETRDGHISVAPVGGRGPADEGPSFDQQPIEVAALADACARAFDVTGNRRWAQGVELAASWFFGANDTGVSLYDGASGGGCDGLEQAGRNENQGAESTLALMSTLQQAHRVALCQQ